MIYSGSQKYKLYVGSSAVKPVVEPVVEPLPYEAEVEYLQSSGTQIINTGISGGSNAEYSVTFMIMPDNASWVHLCGSVRNEQGAPKIQHNNNSVNWQAEWYTGAVVSVNIFAYDSAIHTAEYKNGNLYVDGVVKATPGIYGFGSRNFCLFNYLAENLAGSKVRLYMVSVKLDGDLVRDFIPVRVGSVGYMYDRVSGQLFGNNGSGNFVLGNDK